ncbi:MAG: triose-phosphate isomerase [Deltaproteobacteria bacterium]|nr:triose-phosphate isomerase [Deltaproteobacteria bacterium]MBM4317511.1 triose-phosphate isomerase [Deltaproteobacteria bacterium]
MESRIPLFIANWKMNKLAKDVQAFVIPFNEATQDVSAKSERVLAPTSVYLSALVVATKGTSIHVSAQNCGTAKSGAFTGEVSAAMLKDLGVGWVILGHSERRHIFKEDNNLVNARLKAAIEEGLTPVFCVGEKLEERKANQTFIVIENQLLGLKAHSEAVLKDLVVAYEPVWAIGTGENATPTQAQEVHAFIRQWISKNISSTFANRTRILYGGSVKPENSSQLMAMEDVDGLLVGGASLDPLSFGEIVKKGLNS